MQYFRWLFSLVAGIQRVRLLHSGKNKQLPALHAIT